MGPNLESGARVPPTPSNMQKDVSKCCVHACVCIDIYIYIYVTCERVYMHTVCRTIVYVYIYIIFPRISSPFCVFAFLGFPVFSTNQANNIYFCWGPNSSLVMCICIRMYINKTHTHTHDATHSRSHGSPDRDKLSLLKETVDAKKKISGSKAANLG